MASLERLRAQPGHQRALGPAGGERHVTADVDRRTPLRPLTPTSARSGAQGRGGLPRPRAPAAGQLRPRLPPAVSSGACTSARRRSSSATPTSSRRSPTVHRRLHISRRRAQVSVDGYHTEVENGIIFYQLTPSQFTYRNIDRYSSRGERRGLGEPAGGVTPRSAYAYNKREDRKGARSGAPEPLGLPEALWTDPRLGCARTCAADQRRCAAGVEDLPAAYDVWLAQVSKRFGGVRRLRRERLRAGRQPLRREGPLPRQRRRHVVEGQFQVVARSQNVPGRRHPRRGVAKCGPLLNSGRRSRTAAGPGASMHSSAGAAPAAAGQTTRPIAGTGWMEPLEAEPHDQLVADREIAGLERQARTSFGEVERLADVAARASVSAETRTGVGGSTAFPAPLKPCTLSPSTASGSLPVSHEGATTTTVTPRSPRGVRLRGPGAISPPAGTPPPTSRDRHGLLEDGPCPRRRRRRRRPRRGAMTGRPLRAEWRAGDEKPPRSAVSRPEARARGLQPSAWAWTAPSETAEEARVARDAAADLRRFARRCRERRPEGAGGRSREAPAALIRRDPA